jgi:hypothetical protein
MEEQAILNLGFSAELILKDFSIFNLFWLFPF